MSDDAATKLRNRIGARIRLLRYATYGKHDRQGFLDDMGITKSALQRIEDGEQFPKPPLLIMLKRRCEATYEWIIEGDDARMPRQLAERIDCLLRKYTDKK